MSKMEIEVGGVTHQVEFGDPSKVTAAEVAAVIAEVSGVTATTTPQGVAMRATANKVDLKIEIQELGIACIAQCRCAHCHHQMAAWGTAYVEDLNNPAMQETKCRPVVYCSRECAEAADTAYQLKRRSENHD